MVAVAPVRDDTTMEYRPRGGQWRIFQATDPEVLAVGPAGTGKTLAICWRMHVDALQYPKSRQLMSRATLESLKPAALTTFIESVQPERVGVRYFGGNTVTPAEFQYPNGSVIQVTSLEKPAKVKSSEYDRAYINEVTEVPESTYEMVKSRLRWGRMPFQQIITDCNPAGPKHWVKQRCERGQTRMILTTHKDNPAYWDRLASDWTPLGRTYVETTLAGLTGVERKRLYQGVWAVAEGVVYPAFTATMVQAIDMTALTMRAWRTVMAVDVGTRNPTAILTLHERGDGGHTHVSREVYRTNMTSTDILSAIAQEADIVEPEAIFIDPSAKGYIDDLVRMGYPAKGANNEILTGIQKVRGVLDSGFSIDPSCQNTIDEFGMYAYPDNPRIETDKPEKKYDHAMDALRYGIVGLIGDDSSNIGEALNDYYARQWGT